MILGWACCACPVETGDFVTRTEGGRRRMTLSLRCANLFTRALQQQTPQLL